MKNLDYLALIVALVAILLLSGVPSGSLSFEPLRKLVFDQALHAIERYNSHCLEQISLDTEWEVSHRRILAADVTNQPSVDLK